MPARGMNCLGYYTHSCPGTVTLHCAWGVERGGYRSTAQSVGAREGSARRLTCPSRDSSRACHVRTMLQRSRDSASRDQSQRSRDGGSRAGHVACRTVT
eukprot:3421116-Rhodomonas_salina.2